MTTRSSDLVSLGLLRERLPGERRVALTPADVKTLSAKAIVAVETGAGLEAGFHDAYANSGAHLADLQQVLDGSAVIAKVRAPAASQTPRAGGVLIALGGPDAGLAKRLQERPVSHLALERVPRISRAQAMDVLSSQASVAGYVSVLEGARLLDILLPMLTTAAGIIKPAKMIALGAGVAGLQAIATTRRLGAVTHGFDVRDAAREQIESLGAKFVSVDLAMPTAGRRCSSARQPPRKPSKKGMARRASRNHDRDIDPTRLPPCSVFLHHGSSDSGTSGNRAPRHATRRLRDGGRRTGHAPSCPHCQL